MTDIAYENWEPVIGLEIHVQLKTKSKIFSPDPKVGFIALAHKFSAAAVEGKVLAPAKSIAEMQRIVFNNYLDATVCGLFVVLVVAMCVFAVRISLQALRQAKPTAIELPPGGQMQGASS